MALLDDALGQETSALGASGYSFIDADTLKDADNNRFRIQGIDAAEVEKVTRRGYAEGTSGGAEAASSLRNLANDFGFTNVKPVLDENGEPAIDPFGRQLVDLVDENGQSFKSKILETGVLGTTRYTKDVDRVTSELGQLRREQASLDGTQTDNEWDQARELIAGAANDQFRQNNIFKQTAIDEQQLAHLPPEIRNQYFSRDNVQIRDLDRNIRNESLNPFSDSWEQGWVGVKEASYGMLNLLGESTESEWLADIGEAGVARARTQIRDYGSTITDWKEIGKAKGFLNKVDTIFDYVTNNAALSLPYMAISVGGAAAAPFTGGLSLAAPASVYAGQTWNEQEGENKNAGIAIGAGIAQAALDRIGLGFIVKTGVAPKKLLADAVEELVKKGATREAAEQTVASATRKELAGFVGDVATVAGQQIKSKQVFKNLLAGTAIGSGGEAITEGLQEAIGYTGSHWKEGFDFSELTDRALAGAIAGGTLGGAFSVPGTVYNTGAWADVAVRQAPADQARLSAAAKWAEQEEAEHGRIKSIPELLTETKYGPNNADIRDSFDDKAAAHDRAKKDRTTSETVFDIFASAPALWRGATRFIFDQPSLERSRSLRILADMYGGQLQRTFSGSSFENAKQHKVSIYKNMIDMPNQVFASFNGGNVANAKRRGEISNQIYTKLRNAIDPDTKQFNPDLIPNSDPDKAKLVALQKQLGNLGDRLWQDQASHNPDLGYLDNYLLRYKSFDKAAIYNNKQGFVKALKDEFNFSDSDAKDLVDAIVDSENVNDFSDILEGHQAAGKPGSHKARTLNLSEKDAFQEFMNQDIFANVSNAARSAARFTAHQEYIGDNNSVVNQLLENARAEGVSDEKINQIARQLQDYFSAESGNYKRPTSEFGKRMEKVQRNLMVWMTVAGLPLATISSFVEAALTMRGLTLDQLFGTKGKPGGLYALGNELGSTLWKGMGEISAVADRKQRPPAATSGAKVLQDLGYYEWDVGTASISSTANKVGATEISVRKQKFLENYFKATGLQGWTNYTRAVRASIVGDYINDKLELISTAAEVTNEVQEAREQLRNLGINVNDAVAAYNSGQDINPDELREAQFTFINDAVALPQSANRPLIYQDPRFALFTQFQGFIATFTANHIPKLWDEYVKRGTPAMKYNAFAVMTTMVMLGFASQYLKDLLKYGEPRAFGPDDHPYLSTSEYVQRGVRASGLLGTGERVLDQFFPLYEKQTDGIGEWLWEGVAGESPALGFAGRTAQGVGSLAQGDVGSAAKRAVQATPLGPFNFIRNAAGDAADSWNFDGS